MSVCKKTKTKLHNTASIPQKISPLGINALNRLHDTEMTVDVHKNAIKLGQTQN